jgi:predicted methyltransferase
MTWQREAKVIVAVAIAGITGLAASQSAVEADAARLDNALALRAGHVVADIGAGGGDLTLILARRVGPSGRVYATELDAGRVRSIEAAAGAAALGNVTALEGHALRTNLPEGCCDALVVRFVYHHFKDPASMNASMFRSLKPGGLLAIIDFLPDGPESPDPAGRASDEHHGVSAATVSRELRDAGFEAVNVENSIRRASFMVVVRRKR